MSDPQKYAIIIRGSQNKKIIHLKSHLLKCFPLFVVLPKIPAIF